MVFGLVGSDPMVFLPDVSCTTATDIIKRCNTVTVSDHMRRKGLTVTETNPNLKYSINS